MVDPRRPIVWSPDARADLSEIWNFYAKAAGRQTADKIVREISEVPDCLNITHSLVEPAMKCGPGFDRLQRDLLSSFIV